MINAQGGCLCGALRYEVATQPSRVTMCHCKFCQRATGGAYLVEPIFESQDFKVIKGAPKKYSHTSEGSGKQVLVHFCDTCGTKIFLTFERFGDAVGVYGGTFDDPNWYDVAPTQSKHIFLSVAHKGTVIPAGVNCFMEHATQSDGTVIEPTVFAAPKTI
nr:GFA family protein [Amylibacter sp.]